MLVHGEIFAAPIDRGAEPTHLLFNRPAVLLLPAPNTLSEFFSPEFGALLSLAGQLALDHHLSGNSGVVGSWEPERDITSHAVPARNDVHLRLVQHVPHVQASGHVWRRQQHAENWARIARGR